MTKKSVFLVFVLSALACLLAPIGVGATYYVATDGNDANAGTDPNAPKLTIQDAIDDCNDPNGDTIYVQAGTYGSTTNNIITLGASEDGDDITIEAYTTSPGDGNSTTVAVLDAQQRCITTGTDWTSGALTMKYCHLKGMRTLSSAPVVYHYSGTDASLHFYDCRIEPAVGRSTHAIRLNTVGNPTRDLTLDGCELMEPNDTEASSFAVINDIDVLTVVDTTITGADEAVIFNLSSGKRLHEVYIHNTTCDGGDAFLQFGGNNDGCRSISITDCTITMAGDSKTPVVSFKSADNDQMPAVRIHNNTLTCRGNAINLGANGWTPTYVGAVSVRGNTIRITCPDAHDSQHGVSLLDGVNGELCYNTVICDPNVQWPIVLKDNADVHHNTFVVGSSGILFTNSVNSTFTFNTVIGVGGSTGGGSVTPCLTIHQNLDGTTFAKRAVITDNIIDATDVDVCYRISLTTGPMDPNDPNTQGAMQSIVDRNLYVLPTSGNLARLDQTNYATLSALQAAWDDPNDPNSRRWNDANSQVVTRAQIKFRDFDSNDFRLAPGSVALPAKNDTSAMWQAYGAWGSDPSGGSGWQWLGPDPHIR